MPRARTVTDVIMGEATSGTPAERYRDMQAIASAIMNRAQMLGVTPEQVVANSKEFNAYGKALPAGVEAYQGMAQQAWQDVATNGPTHQATFYATPKAAENLPGGLKQEVQTAGHVFYSDPQKRAIGTSLGYVSPRAPQKNPGVQAIEGLLSAAPQPATIEERMGSPAPQPGQDMANRYISVPQRAVQSVSFKPPEQMSLDSLRPQPMSMAQQYAAYDAGKAQTVQNGLLAQDVAQQKSMDGLRQGLLAQKQDLQAGVNPMDAAAPWSVPQAPQAMTPQQVQPMQTMQNTQPTQPMSYTEPMGPTPSSVVGQPYGGLLSGPEAQAYQAQYQNLSTQPFNKAPSQIGNKVKSGVGMFGGALLGGALLGPLGGLLGGYLGKKSVQPGGLFGGAFPAAPVSANRGDGSMTDYGRSVHESSGQFRDAVSSGSAGLW